MTFFKKGLKRVPGNQSKKLVKICSFMLAAAFVAVSTAGCSRQPEDEAGSAGNTAGAALYDEMEIGNKLGLKIPGNIRVNSKNQLVVADQGENQYKFVLSDREGKRENEFLCDLSSRMIAFDLDPQDNIYAVTSEAVSESEINQKISVLDSTGKLKNTFELGKFNYKDITGTQPFAMDIAVDGEGNMYVATLDGIMALDKTGKIRKIGTGSYYSIDMTPDHNIVAICWAKSKNSIDKIDSTSGKSIWSIKREIKADGSYSSGSDKIRYNSSKDCICVMNSNSLTSYDGNGKEIEKILDFSKYMILASGNRFADMSIDGSGNIYVLTAGENKYELYKYNIEAGAKKVKDRKTITLAVPAAGRWLEAAALKFQQVNTDYKIDIKSYGEDYVKTVNTQLLTGKGPDIINTSSIPFEKYADKNMLVDLETLMDNDKNFDKGKYFGNLFDAFRYKDRLYSIPVSFSFDMLTASKKVLDEENIQIDDGSWNWDDLREMGQKVSAGAKGRKMFLNMSCRSLLEYMLKGNYNSFVNPTEKKALFDSPEFINLLKLVKEYGDGSLPNDVIEKNPNYGDIDAIEKNSVVFNTQTLSDYIHFSFLQAIYSGQVRLLNYPAAEGSSGGIFSSDTIFSINSNSGAKETAWEFLKFLLSEEVQSGELGGFPVNRNSLGLLAEKDMKMISGGQISIGISTKSDKNPKVINPKPLTQKDIQYVNSFIEKMTVCSRNNAGIYDVVINETLPFFSGQKTAEEVAGIIQQKVSIYLGE